MSAVLSSFRFTQRLNVFCFELTNRCKGSIPFFSLSLGFLLDSYDASVDTSERNSSGRPDTSICYVCVCVRACLFDIVCVSSEKNRRQLSVSLLTVKVNKQKKM